MRRHLMRRNGTVRSGDRAFIGVKSLIKMARGARSFSNLARAYGAACVALDVK